MFKRFYRLIVLALCAALFLGIAAVFYVKFYWNRLQVANVFVDFSSFVLLASGYFFIRRKNIRAHITCQIAALSASVYALFACARVIANVPPLFVAAFEMPPAAEPKYTPTARATMPATATSAPGRL